MREHLGAKEGGIECGWININYLARQVCVFSILDPDLPWCIVSLSDESSEKGTVQHALFARERAPRQTRAPHPPQVSRMPDPGPTCSGGVAVVDQIQSWPAFVLRAGPRHMNTARVRRWCGFAVVLPRSASLVTLIPGS